MQKRIGSHWFWWFSLGCRKRLIFELKYFFTEHRPGAERDALGHRHGRHPVRGVGGQGGGRWVARGGPRPCRARRRAAALDEERAVAAVLQVVCKEPAVSLYQKSAEPVQLAFKHPEGRWKAVGAYIKELDDPMRAVGTKVKEFRRILDLKWRIPWGKLKNKWSHAARPGRHAAQGRPTRQDSSSRDWPAAGHFLCKKKSCVSLWKQNQARQS